MIDSGGVERRRLSMVRLLPRDAYEHHVICTSATGPVAEALRQEGVEITEVGPVRSVLAPGRYRTAAEVVRRWKPDLIHGAIIEGYTLSGVLGLLNRGTRIVMEETSFPDTRRVGGHALARLMAAVSDVCVGVSPAVGRYLRETLRVPAEQVAVINNGVPVPRRPSELDLRALRARHGIVPGDRIIGSVGRVFDRTKRFSDLISAFAQLGDIERLKLLIVGDGPDLEALKAHAARLGVSERVIFTGFQANVGHYYALMEVFALGSATEAFGLVLAEAMRAGLPVVATNVGGIPDVVVHEESGLIVEPFQPASMASALRRVLESPALRTRLARHGRERADREFAEERYVADVGALYERLLSEPR